MQLCQLKSTTSSVALLHASPDVAVVVWILLGEKSNALVAGQNGARDPVGGRNLYARRGGLVPVERNDGASIFDDLRMPLAKRIVEEFVEKLNWRIVGMLQLGQCLHIAFT